MIAVDTNVLLRYLLEPIDSKNPSWQVVEAAKVIHQADDVFISDIVMVEIEGVLESVFELTTKEIAELMADLISNSKFKFEDWSAIQCALLDYRENSKIELSDYIIARHSNHIGCKTLYTFEKETKLGRLSIVTSLKKE